MQCVVWEESGVMAEDDFIQSNRLLKLSLEQNSNVHQYNTRRKLDIDVNVLKPTSHVMHQQFNIQQLYFLPTLYLCVLYLSENKQRLVSLTA
jgi:hypothetical protein